MPNHEDLEYFFSSHCVFENETKHQRRKPPHEETALRDEMLSIQRCTASAGRVKISKMLLDELNTSPP